MENVTGQFSEGGTLRECFNTLVSGEGNFVQNLSAAFNQLVQDPIAASMVFGTVGLAAGGAFGSPLIGALVGGLGGYFAPEIAERTRSGPAVAAPAPAAG